MRFYPTFTAGTHLQDFKGEDLLTGIMGVFSTDFVRSTSSIIWNKIKFISISSDEFIES